MLLANQILHILCIFIKPNVWYSWSLKILAIKRWFPFNFAKIFHYVVGGPKSVKLWADISFESGPKYCIVEFTAIFVCLLLSWSRRYSMKWSSNFDGPNFNNNWPLYLNFPSMTNLCPNIWYNKNWKCQQILFWKRSCRKNKHFSYF